LAFGCRICHDECPVLPPPLSVKKQKQLYDSNDDDDDDGYDDDDNTDHTNDPSSESSNHLTQQAETAAAALDAMDHAAKKSKVDRRRSMPIDLEEEETHHEIDRFAIREVICRQCYTRQSSKT